MTFLLFRSVNIFWISTPTKHTSKVLDVSAGLSSTYDSQNFEKICLKNMLPSLITKNNNPTYIDWQSIDTVGSKNIRALQINRIKKLIP